MLNTMTLKQQSYLFYLFYILILVWVFNGGLHKFSGPRLDLDPDVVAALDDALDLENPDNILEDDFVLKVMRM